MTTTPKRPPFVMPTLEGATVLVLGLGASGLAMARWCAAAGAAVRVWDSRAAPPHAEALKGACPQAQLVGGVVDVGAALVGVDRVLKSPGLAPHDARIAPLLAAARVRGLAVQGELDLFGEALAALGAARGYAPQVVAITGTNGKTTTTAMTALIVARCGKRVAMAGNIGPTMLDTLAHALSRVEGALVPSGADGGDALPEVWVLELSSFQLDGVEGFEPDAAAVLNLTQDHLDWHGDAAAYGAAKARVLGRHGTVVLNRDDPAVEAMAPAAVPVAGGRAAKARAAAAPARPVVRFGTGVPQRPGDFGIATENGIAWLVRARPDDSAPGRHRIAAPPAVPALQQLMPADALQVRGRHNAANALAALALATAIGCPLAGLLHGLAEYRGEPHRVAFVARIVTAAGEVTAWDDSKGTNVGATVAAIDGLAAEVGGGKLVVVLGGDGKGQDFSPLAAPVARHARAVALIGRDAAAIEAALAATGVPMRRHADLEAATAWCFAQAEGGDAVLLSPACASLDMFRDYAHRAEVFVAAVRALALEHGEAVV